MNGFLKTGGMILGSMIVAVGIIYLASLPPKIGVILIFGLITAGLAMALLNNPKALVSAIVAYPAFIIFWSIIFPGMKYRIEEAIFPVINLGFMRLRVEELIFYGLTGIWLTLMFFFTMNRKKQRSHLSSWFILLVLVMCLWTALSVRLGFLNDNPNVTTELRQIAPILLGLPMAVWALRRIEPSRLRGIVKTTVFLLFVSNLLLLFSLFPFIRNIPYFSIWYQEGASHPAYCFTIILFVGLFSLLLSGQPSLWTLAGMLAPLSIAIFRIPKWWLFGISIGSLFGIYTAFCDKSGFHLYTRKFNRLVVFSLFAGLAIAISAIFFSEIAGQSLEKFKQRVLREDAGGDMSGGRFRIWALITERIAEHPIVGHGLGFRIKGILPASIEAEGQYMEDHNIVLWIAARFGIPFLLLLAGLTLRFWRTVRRVYQAEDRPFQKILILACTGNFIVILCMSLVGQWLFVFESSILFTWSVAVVLALCPRDRQARCATAGLPNEQ